MQEEEFTEKKDEIQSKKSSRNSVDSGITI
jgi:hypothetical protein